MKREKTLFRVLEGIFIAVVGGVLVFLITTIVIPRLLPQTPPQPTPQIENSSDLRPTEDAVNNDQSSRSDSEANTSAKNTDELNGFVVNGVYYSRRDESGSRQEIPKPNEAQNEVKVSFVGPDVTGWSVTIKLPEEQFSISLTSNYHESIDFYISNGLFELQVFSDDDQIETVYYGIIDVTTSGSYLVELEEADQWPMLP